MIRLKTLLVAVIVFGYIPAFSQPDLPDRSKDAASLYVDAVKARMLDDLKQEESLLNEVIRLKPEEAAPHYDLSRLYQKQRKYDQAEQEIEKAIARDTANLWYLATYADILESQNKVKEAAAVYRELAAKEKFNKEYIFMAARLYEASGSYKEAVELIDQLIQKMGTEELLLLQKQQLYLRMNDLSAAVKVAEELISLNPQDERYHLNLAELYNSNNHPEKAEEIYTRVLKEFPDRAQTQYAIAQYYKGKNDIRKYDEYIRKAILNSDFDDETQASILFSYLRELSTDSIRKKESVGITRQLADLHPDNPQIIYLYGDVLADNDESDQARVQFKKAVSLDPSRFIAWQRLLFSYTDRNDADSLIHYSEKALRYFPNQAIVHYLHGIGHFHKKAYSSAAKSLNRAIDFQPEDNRAFLADMYSALGDVYHAAGNNNESDEAYQKALELNPKNATVLNNYAYYLALRGIRLKDAEAMSAKSLTLRPDEPTFLDTYGWILYRKGEYAKAKEYIQKALDKNPDADGTLYDHLGDIYYKLNDKEKAIEFWKKAKEKGTENTWIDKKIQDGKLYE